MGVFRVGRVGLHNQNNGVWVEGFWGDWVGYDINIRRANDPIRYGCRGNFGLDDNGCGCSIMRSIDLGRWCGGVWVVEFSRAGFERQESMG